jgi:hypothetical protein
MMTQQKKLLETLKARVQERREKAIAEGKPLQVREIHNPLIEKLKARAKAEGKELKPMPLTDERMKKMVERFKARTIKKEE